MRRFLVAGAVIQAVGSIVGIVALVLLDRTAAIIALAYILLSVTTMVGLAYAVVRKHIRSKYPRGHTPVALFALHSTADGVHYRLDVYRTIIAKQLVLTSVPFEFLWTGTGDSPVTSDLQKPTPPVLSDDGRYHRVLLRFDEPLLYNDAGVVHVRIHADDHDGTAEPAFGCKVEGPLQVVHIRVELRYLPPDYVEPAVFERRPIEGIFPDDWEHLTGVPFDPVGRCYERILVRPTVGFHYRIRWLNRAQMLKRGTDFRS